MNRIGVKFARKDFAKYIAHLDLQRLFNRAIRRAGIPAQYSQGFNPHMQLSFASPLAVGVESKGDYFEFFTAAEADIDIAKALEALQETMPKGINALAMGILPEKGKKLMALTQAAQYKILPENDAFAIWMEKLWQQDSYMVERERKGKKRSFDARPLLYDFSVSENAVDVTLANSGSASLGPLFLLAVAAKELHTLQQARIIRQDLLMETEGKLAPLSALFE